MNKKVLGVFLALCMLVAALPTAVFAKKTASDEIDEAIKAIKTNKNDVVVFNDMTMDEFLRAAAKVLPDDNTCTLSFEKEADYRIYNASSQKDGSIIANILFTSSYETPYPVTRHEMYDFKIAQLTGDAAEANEDVELLDEDRKNVANAYKNMSFDYTVTEEKIVEMARAAVKYGTTVESAGDFTLKEPTVKNRGSVKLTLNLTLNDAKTTVKVSNVVRQLEAAPTENNNSTADANKSSDKDVSDYSNGSASEDSNTSSSGSGYTTGEPKAALSFNDVAKDAYYADAVEWAVESNITTGTSSTTFSPDMTCTRAQILTFIWRAAGSPSAETVNPFSDVKDSDYYYDAAIWAFENDMVKGSTFDADTPCTRASTVLYLWKYNGSPVLGSLSQFADVAEDAEYADAVSWAVYCDITTGVSDSEFAPDMVCSRGQIVTFLYRAF